MQDLVLLHIYTERRHFLFVADLCLPTVKILKFHDECYDWVPYEDLKQLFPIFPNLTELLINRYDLENAASYLYEHDGDRDLLQLKHLHTFTVETDDTFQGSSELSEEANEFKKCFRKRLSKIVLGWITPNGKEEDNDDDNTEEDADDGDDEED
ncbi:unnamed protein product [Didymodactylos carnosus]|uniref:Uncharacterized protein n=1 Tax=Didymodactylos carnosus TaxID=1234261 RepID=A0A815ZS80_9BILA|nr:unnamed protein product [Didymodactylos carnosus]CAF1586132.1 unnamed protein product [Didymodactylos carnosus]CAF4373747.1 unnamed protein product [Didymodactylos carnosus]CAF4455779.1 unnamed protein product [Didymodactylos carnosus]